ncbi:serine protease inhibitor Kazal-type 11-like [Arvicanthis niloticus]|uniref:serine protease inhibitor Kazal-type 11-like n=1 Tax=Arvicanthis niloticus TaxID=61156 RepID=UPI00402BDCDD
MSSTCIKFLFILTLVLLLYFETAVESAGNIERQPNCTMYRHTDDCSNTLIPVCADDRISYYNECYFCIEKQFDKMSSTWIKFLFILTLVLLPYFETAIASPENTKQEPNCNKYKNKYGCSLTMDLICADDGNIYYNECTFCKRMLKKKIKYRYHGICT